MSKWPMSDKEGILRPKVGDVEGADAASSDDEKRAMYEQIPPHGGPSIGTERSHAVDAAIESAQAMNRADSRIKAFAQMIEDADQANGLIPISKKERER